MDSTFGSAESPVRWRQILRFCRDEAPATAGVRACMTSKSRRGTRYQQQLGLWILWKTCRCSARVTLVDFSNSAPLHQMAQGRERGTSMTSRAGGSDRKSLGLEPTLSMVGPPASSPCVLNGCLGCETRITARIHA